MKWLLMIYDPDCIYDEVLSETEEFQKLATEQEYLKKFLDLDIVISSNKENPGQLVVDYVEHMKGDTNPDKNILVYDGNCWADGIANQAAYAISYSKENINHHTTSLIDTYTDFSYNKENAIKLLANILYIIYKRFACDVSYPKDEMTLEEKIARVDELKKYF